MPDNSFYKRFMLDDSILKKTQFNPYYKVVSGMTDDFLKVDAKGYIDLATNNYLGIANHPDIIQACKDALDTYGASMCATPIAGGQTDLYKKVATHLSSFVGIESSLIYPSCYQANLGLFSVIADSTDVILIDQYAHSSLIEGARAIGCKLRPYLHNNMESLEKNLIHSQSHRQRFVVTESVFSTEGSIAPLKNIVDLCHQYDAIPVVDDSHGIGVIGKGGCGILQHAYLDDFDGIYTASLGKALAGIGGMLGGKKSLMDYLRYYSSHLVYSTAIAPHCLAGLEVSLKLIESQYSELHEKMWNNRHRISEALTEAEFQLGHSEAPIISVQTGSSEATILLAKQLFENRIISTAFIYPSVPKDKGVVRLIAGANLKAESLNTIIECIHKLNVSVY